MAKTKKHTANRRSKKMNVGKSLSLGVLRTSRMVQVGVIAKSAADSGLGRSFTLSSLPGSSEYVALFNEYRVTSLEYIYELPRSILSTAFPRLSFAVDINDAANPSVESDVLQYKDVKVFQYSQTRTRFSYKFTPKAALAAFQGAFSGYASAPDGMWFNTDNAGIQYYGVKEWLANYNSTSTPNTDVILYVRAHLEFRRPR